MKIVDSKQALSVIKGRDKLIYCTHQTSTDKFGKIKTTENLKDFKAEKVNVGLVDSKFALIPKDIHILAGRKSWPLELRENIETTEQKKLKNFADKFIFDSSVSIEKQEDLELNINHLGTVFLDWIEIETQFPEVHVAKLMNNLFVAVTEDYNLKFFNIFDVESVEDLSFYVLSVFKDYDKRVTPLKFYGETDKSFLKLIKKEISEIKYLNLEDTSEEFFLKRLARCD